ncbi:MAG: YihY/virulence factor BrkB family protein [Planctomycetes bacterium]|nr:YihY/virulence factor BrkB family protein [Planctomycetota bacterium]HPF14780.1 YihY/virulence factor BrkB family protein [Planctomycetota bacterium]HRV80428.1 YihY/virulence factor BrkB family protein [Planctomycetota bacterium]
MESKYRNQPVRPVWWPLWLQPAWDFLNRDLWSAELGGLPTFRRFFYRVSRILYLATRGIHLNHCMFRASGLAFITVLSLVPLLAVAFSVAKGLGAYDRLRNEVIDPFLNQTFETPVPVDGVPTAMGVREAIDQVLTFVQGTNVGNLGTIGLLALIYTVIKLLASIEGSFNEIWGVRKARTWVRKFADYLSMVVVVPLVLVTATAFMTSLKSQAVREKLETLHLGPAWEQILGLGTLVALWLGFAFMYLFLPNTRVRVRSALLGGVVGGTMWWVVQMGHVGFQLNVAKYNALYSSLAAIPLFLFWVYLSWVTVLMGAELACAHQNEPAYRQLARAREFDQGLREVVAVRAMARIAAAFLQGKPPQRPLELAGALGIPERTLVEVFQSLVDAHVLVFAEDEFQEDAAVVPARDLEQIQIQDIYDALAGKRGPAELASDKGQDTLIDQLRKQFEDERAHVAGNINMKELGQRLLAGV